VVITFFSYALNGRKQPYVSVQNYGPLPDWYAIGFENDFRADNVHPTKQVQEFSVLSRKFLSFTTRPMALIDILNSFAV